MSRMTDTNKAWLLSFISGQNFYHKKMKNSEVTELTYISRLKSYCDNVGKNPDELIQLKLEGLQNPATEKEFQAEELLENFLRQDKIKFLKEDKKTKEAKKEERKFTDNAKFGILVAIKSFYESTRGRSLAPDTGEFIEVPEPKKRSPTVPQCLDLENAMKCNRDKFLVWFLESCPVRKNTLKQLKFSDLKPLNDKDVPFWLRIEAKRLKGSGKGKYRKAKHVGFLHYYAVQKFEAYKAELKRKGILFNDDSPLIMSYKSTPQGSRKGLAQAEFFTIFRDASENAWHDLSKHRFSPHDLRDVISTVLLNPKVRANTNLTKPLTSHVPTGIEATYENPDDSEDKPNSDLLAVFKSCIPFLVPETIPELKIELNEQKAENQKQQTQQQQQIELMKEDNKKQAEEQNKKLEKQEILISEILMTMRNKLLYSDASKQEVVTELFKKVENSEEFKKRNANAKPDIKLGDINKSAKKTQKGIG